MAISLISLLAAIKYKAGSVIQALATRPVYRIQGDSRITHRAGGDAGLTHRTRSESQTTHRVRVEAR